LAPAGTAGFVLANGSMSSNQSGEGEIRKAIVEADLVDCMVALPGQLFYATQIPVCCGFSHATRRTAAFATTAARPCSSTRESSAPWSTACTAS
jgi:type I restriction enzyme M protein